MSEKASGFDWKKKNIYTIRHAAGEKYVNKKQTVSGGNVCNYVEIFLTFYRDRLNYITNTRDQTHTHYIVYRTHPNFK